MWIKYGDEVHEETEELSPLAKALHFGALYCCGKRLSDGYLSPGAFRSVVGWANVPPATVDELVRAGLWEDRGGGAYYITTYLRDNPSKADKEAKSQTLAVNGKAGGVRSGEARRANAEAKSKQFASQNRSNLPSKIEANAEATSEARISVSPYPVTPSPPLPPSEEGGDNARPRLIAHTHEGEPPRLAVAGRRDERWHAIARGLATGTGVTPQTPNARRTRAQCVDQLHAIVPEQWDDDVIAACRDYARTWPHLTLSDNAIVNNYERFMPGSQVRTNGQGKGRAAPTAEQYDAAEREANELSRRRQGRPPRDPPDAIDATFTHSRRHASD